MVKREETGGKAGKVTCRILTNTANVIPNVKIGQIMPDTLFVALFMFLGVLKSMLYPGTERESTRDVVRMILA